MTTHERRLIELLYNAAREMDCPTPEQTAFYLIDRGVNIPVCKIGDKVYEVMTDDMEEYDNKPWIGEMTVSEVGLRKIFISTIAKNPDDTGHEIPITDIGINVFLTKEDAERRRDEICASLS